MRPASGGTTEGCAGPDPHAARRRGERLFHAREQLNVTTVIFSNRRYAILDLELRRVGAVAGGDAAGGDAAGGDAARSLLDLSCPDLDFTAFARGMGVPAARAASAGEFASELRRALGEPGPHLIEAPLSQPG